MSLFRIPFPGFLNLNPLRRRMLVEKQYLDRVLVPTGLLFMVAYHVYLLYRIMHHPNSTVIGFENANRRIWVQQMMEDVPTHTALALQVITSNLSTATYMATLSITISSLIGAIVGNISTSRSSERLTKHIIYGDTGPTVSSIKYASLLICFLVAFMAHIQSIRYYTHASFLISTPGSSVPVDYVENSVVRASYFWTVGLRAYYFAFTLLLWIFGPIPMFACSLGMIFFLYFLDSTAKPIPPFTIKAVHKEGTRMTARGIQSSSGRQKLGSILLAAEM